MPDRHARRALAPSRQPRCGRRDIAVARAVGVSLLAAALAFPAAAQLRGSGEYLQRMDRDGDGRVSLAEYQAWMGYAFERMDRNGDGVLTASELPGGRGREVSLAAHRQALAAAFGRQDGNRDGFLDARELAAPPQ